MQRSQNGKAVDLLKFAYNQVLAPNFIKQRMTRKEFNLQNLTKLVHET